MKRIISAIIAFSAVLTIAGCNNKKSSEKEAKNSSVSETTTEAVQASTQPDPLATTEKTTVPATEATEATTAPATEVSTEKTEDPDVNSFYYNGDGAVVFGDDYEKENDATLMAAAESLFVSACQTEWKYTVGCPYETNTEDYIENDFQWRFYRITDSNIKSFADLENDYYKVFSKKYPNQLNELFIESNGAVYALDAARGMDIFYENSTITEIKSKTDDEIFFTVENHYSGTDTDVNTPATKTDTFSVVIESDGAWRAGEFNLPY